MRDPIYIRCECSSLDHMVVLERIDWMTEPQLAVTVRLESTNPFWKRVVTAICYVLGRRCRFGSWTEVLIDRACSERIREALVEYEAALTEAEARRAVSP